MMPISPLSCLSLSLALSLKPILLIYSLVVVSSPASLILITSKANKSLVSGDHMLGKLVISIISLSFNLFNFYFLFSSMPTVYKHSFVSWDPYLHGSLIPTPTPTPTLSLLTSYNQVWPMAWIVQALTAPDTPQGDAEVKSILEYLKTIALVGRYVYGLYV